MHLHDFEELHGNRECEYEATYFQPKQCLSTNTRANIFEANVMGQLTGRSPTHTFGVCALRSHRIIGLVGSLLHDCSVCVLYCAGKRLASLKDG